MVISDWFGNRGAEAVAAGLDIEMPGVEPRYFGRMLEALVKEEKVRPLTVFSYVSMVFWLFFTVFTLF